MLTTITTTLTAVALSLSGFFGTIADNVLEVFAPEPTELGREVNAVGGKTYTLYGGGIDASVTTVTLTSFTIPVSNALYSMAHFGDGVNAKGYLTIEPGSPTKQEFISFTGITQNSDGTATLTGVSRGLAPVYPYSASTTYAKAHLGGSIVVISNPPQLYEAIYSYIDNATTSGAVDAAASVKGLLEVASGQEAASTTQIGAGNTTAPLALTTLISTSSVPASGHYIPVTQADGSLAVGFKFGSSTIRTYTTTGTSTWTKPSYLSMVRVQLWGAGGSGANGTGAGDEAGGGGGGAYCETWFMASTLNATETVAVGTGGAAKTTDTSGDIGGSSHFGLRLIAYGGGGGMQGASGASGGGGGGCFKPGGTPSDTITGGTAGDILATAGGTSTKPALAAYSGAGAGGSRDSAGGVAGGDAIWGGAGGASVVTGSTASGGTSLYGGNGGTSASSATSTDGSQPGGGGGGSFQGESGSGGDGKIVITEYF